MPIRPQVLVPLLGAGLALGGLAAVIPAPAQAVGGVFISEIHYDDDGADEGEFVEITAPAGTDLSAYAIVRYNGSGGAVYTTPAASNSLTGTATDQGSGWGTGVVSYPVDGLQNGAPDGIALTHLGTLVEFVSWEGSFAAVGGPAGGRTSIDVGVSEPGSTPAGHSLQRQADGSWTGPAAHTKGVPNGYDGGDSGGGELAAVNEPNATVTANEAMTDVVLDATGGTPPYSWATDSTLPSGVSLSAAGVMSGTPTETGSFPITATVTDDEGATAHVGFTLTVAVAGAATPIAEIQGTGSASPKVGQTVTTTGVVTATYPTGGFNGFYLQTPGPDITPGASDGVFVYGPTFDESTLALGDSVRVTGNVVELNTLTEINATTVTEIADLGDVVPNTVVPGTDCALPGTGCPSVSALESQKEELEGEVFQPSDAYTVTDVYDGGPFTGSGPANFNNVGELGLAASSELPLVAPTEVIDAQAIAAISARTAYNNAHRVILDDGSSTTYWNTANNASGKDTPMPWFTPTNQVRVGAAVDFVQPVVLDYRFGWKLQPVHQVVGAGTELVSFDQTREATPVDVGGDIKLATFNVLNYFTTLGGAYGGCTSYKDRANNPIAVNQCPTGGPRGAWNQVNFERQQAKIVTAINTLDADIVSVEEIENSLVVDGGNRDEALAALVAALNTAAGAGTWDYVDSPASASTATNRAYQDVIRTAFIFKPAAVELVGAADMLFGTPEFDNAREPFAQTFKVAGADDADGFAVIANHFKSKGSGVDDGTGQGASNPSRVAQAERLLTYADDFAASRGVDAVFLTGDFNAYSQEDPMQVLYGGGYENLAPEGKWSYSFDGQSGSLDHVLGNDAAAALVTGVDIWETNANETVFAQYSRYNYNATLLYDASPFGASDHNPEIVGIGSTQPSPAVVTAGNVSLEYGRVATVPVTVSANGAVPTGRVVLKQGGTVVGAGDLVDGAVDATLYAKRLPVGAHDLTVVYPGDGSVQPGTGTARVTVAKATPTVTRSRTVVEYGKSTLIPVRVAATGLVPTGTVHLSVSGTSIGSGALANGLATVEIAAKALPPSAAAYTVDVSYSGDDVVRSAIQTAVLVVQKATPTVTGADVTMRGGTVSSMPVQVSAEGVVPTGRVVLYVGDVVLGAGTLTDGAATATIGRNKVPASETPYTVTVKYVGDGFVKPGTTTAQLTVNP